MDIEDLVRRHGGFTSRAALIRATSRRDVDAALRSGAVVRLAHGRYALPSIDAAGVGGVLCLTSAALHHGWEVRLARVCAGVR